MIEFKSYKEICDIQTSYGNKFSSIYYELYSKEFEKYSHRILNNKHPIIMNNESFNGVSYFNSTGCMSFRLNDSYFLNLKEKKLEDINELVKLILSDSTSEEEFNLIIDNNTPNIFQKFKVPVVKLYPTYEEFLKTLNCKQRSNLKSLQRKNSNVSFDISTSYNHESALYYLNNSHKHDTFEGDEYCDPCDIADYTNSLLLHAIAFSLQSTENKAWFQTIRCENSIVGYSAVLDLFKSDTLYFYANCTDKSLGTLAINNFVEYFSGSQYKYIDCSVEPDYPWIDKEENINEVYKKKISNDTKEINVLSLSDKQYSYFTKPYYSLKDNKFIKAVQENC